MKILFVLTIIAFLVKSEVFTLGILAVWGIIGLIKFLKFMAKGGAFD